MQIKLLLFLMIFCLSALANAQLIKVSALGVSLTSDAEQWRCVLDTQSNLLWEVKQNTQGLHNSNNTYTWFNGIFGKGNGEQNGEYSQNCPWMQNCNTQAFINALNAQQLCQSSDWRLPNEAQLNSLLIYNDNNPLIDSAYFPNTKSGLYWTINQADYGDTAIAVPFFYGGTRGNGKSFDVYVRGVTDAVK